MNFSERSKFYSEPWLSPRDERGLREFGLLPDIQGAYKFEDEPASVDAVILSHSHTDHSSYISFLNRDIPIYCGVTTSTILQTFAEIIPKGFDNDLEGLEFRTFRTGDKFKVGSVEVEPVHVDHSVPGSYGLILYTSEGAMIYSGDFRMHGTKPQLTHEFINAAKDAKPIAMLCEGTNLIGADFSTEQEVKVKVDKVVSTSQNLVLATFRNTDVDRTETLREVAKQNNRRLTVSLRQAYVLNRLNADEHLDLPDVKSSDFLIFRREKKQYYKWEQTILDLPNVIDAHDVRKRQKEVILATAFSDLKELLDMQPEPGSSFILSSSEPFNEEMEIEYDKFVNWLDHFGLPMYHIHCSGHIMPTEIKQAIREISPKTLFPIHTEHPELFGKYVADITKVTLPQRKKTHPIT